MVQILKKERKKKIESAAIDPPLVVLEDMASESCVIATPIQSIPYILGTDRGVIIKGHCIEDEIYNALKMLSNDTKRLKTYATNAKRWVISNHSLSIVNEIMKKIICLD